MCRWWSGKSARSLVLAARRAHHTCTGAYHCVITRCCGNCGTGCRSTGSEHTGVGSMSDNAGDAKRALLAQAADEMAADAGLGDVRNYLRAYYRHVAAEDVIAAGPERIGAAAAAQAEFARQRPQGRALVRV